MPARLTVTKRLALAGAVRAVDFVRAAQDQERVAVDVHVGVLLKLRARFRDRHLPAQRIRLVESLFDDFVHSLRVDVLHVSCRLSSVMS